jgi:hypothetical protein
LRRPSVPSPVFQPEYELRVAHLGEFVALARAHVPRSRNEHEPLAPPSPEGNTRLPQQFAQIGRGAAVLAGRGEVSEADFALVFRAAFDCIPGVRATIIRGLCNATNPYSIGLPSSLVCRTLEDLEVLGLAERSNDGERSHALTQCALRLLEGTGTTFPQNVYGRYGSK